MPLGALVAITLALALATALALAKSKGRERQGGMVAFARMLLLQKLQQLAVSAACFADACWRV